MSNGNAFKITVEKEFQSFSSSSSNYSQLAIRTNSEDLRILNWAFLYKPFRLTADQISSFLMRKIERMKRLK